MSNANAIAPFSMPLANHLIRLRIDACDGMTDDSRPYCAASEGDFAALSGDTCIYQCRPFASHCVYPRYCPVALVQDPDGASTHCEETGLRTYRSLVHNFVSPGIHADQPITCVGGDPDRTIRKDRVERVCGNANA